MYLAPGLIGVFGGAAFSTMCLSAARSPKRLERLYQQNERFRRTIRLTPIQQTAYISRIKTALRVLGFLGLIFIALGMWAVVAAFVARP